MKELEKPVYIVLLYANFKVKTQRTALMGKIIAYLRASTDKQDLSHQKLEILEFARRQGLHVDEYVEITVSSRKTSKQRRIDELLQTLVETDTLIVTELSRLGRSTAEVIALVNALVERNIRLVAIKQNLDVHRQDMNSKIIITLFSLFAELERDLISLRTKEALAAKKAQGKPLGKPKGTLQKSKFDKDVVRIKELLDYGLSVRKIARILGCSSHFALNTYINKRGLRAVGNKPKDA
ncbi:recombinase family protein [Rhodoblastus sp.]|uniref:recombinase family protein n=1 Tax=Rhodoblastus sp. TaxID=1962975 RepID=UPI003F9D7884